MAWFHRVPSTPPERLAATFPRRTFRPNQPDVISVSMLKYRLLTPEEVPEDATKSRNVERKEIVQAAFVEFDPSSQDRGDRIQQWCGIIYRVLKAAREVDVVWH